MSTAKNILRTINLLTRGHQHSSLTLSQRLPCCRAAACKVLKSLHDARLIHVVAWEKSGNQIMPRYAWGVDADDALRPPALTPREKWLKQQADPEHRKRHREADNRYKARLRLAQGKMPSLLDMPSVPTLRMRNGSTKVRVHRMGDDE